VRDGPEVTSTSRRPPGDFGADAEVAAPAPANNELDATAAGTTVGTRDRVVANETPAEILLEVPGTHVVMTGAQGAFSSVALRGAELSQTTYLIGDVPLSGPDTGGLDLSLMPLAAFERIEVYRGGAPAWLNAGAIGGVVRLVPRRDPRSSLGAALTVGSFASWRADLDGSVATDDTRVTVDVGADGSRNDYPYRYTNATALDPSDDETRRRGNADTLGAHGLLHVSRDVGDGELTALLFGTSRQGGAPGAGDNPALHARRSNARFLGTLAYRHRFERGDLQLVAGGGLQQHRFTDLETSNGEIGLGREATDDRFAATFGRVAGRIELAPILEATMVGTFRRDAFRPENTVRADPGDSLRHAVAGAVELRLYGRAGGVAFELRPSARLEHSLTEARGLRHGAEETHRTRRTAPTFRVGGLVSPVPGSRSSRRPRRGSVCPRCSSSSGTAGRSSRPPICSRRRVGASTGGSSFAVDPVRCAGPSRRASSTSRSRTSSATGRHPSTRRSP